MSISIIKEHVVGYLTAQPIVIEPLDDQGNEEIKEVISRTFRPKRSIYKQIVNKTIDFLINRTEVSN